MSDQDDLVHRVLGFAPFSSYSDDDVRRTADEMKIILTALEKEEALKSIVDAARVDIDAAVAQHFNRAALQSTTMPQVGLDPKEANKPTVLAKPYWGSDPPSPLSDKPAAKPPQSTRHFRRRAENDALDSETKALLWLIVAGLVMVIPLKFIQDAMPPSSGGTLDPPQKRDGRVDPPPKPGFKTRVQFQTPEEAVSRFYWLVCAANSIDMREKGAMQVRRDLLEEARSLWVDKYTDSVDLNTFEQHYGKGFYLWTPPDVLEKVPRQQFVRSIRNDGDNASVLVKLSVPLMTGLLQQCDLVRRNGSWQILRMTESTIKAPGIKIGQVKNLLKTHVQLLFQANECRDSRDAARVASKAFSQLDPQYQAFFSSPAEYVERNGQLRSAQIDAIVPVDDEGPKWDSHMLFYVDCRPMGNNAFFSEETGKFPWQRMFFLVMEDYDFGLVIRRSLPPISYNDDRYWPEKELAQNSLIPAIGKGAVFNQDLYDGPVDKPRREESGGGGEQTAPSNAVAPTNGENQNSTNLDHDRAPFAWLGDLIVRLIGWAAMPLLLFFLLAALLGARFAQRLVRFFITMTCDLIIWSFKHVIWPTTSFMGTAVKSITGEAIARLPQKTRRVLALVVVSILALIMLIVFVVSLVAFLQK